MKAKPQAPIQNQDYGTDIREAQALLALSPVKMINTLYENPPSRQVIFLAYKIAVRSGQRAKSAAILTYLKRQ